MAVGSDGWTGGRADGRTDTGSVSRGLDCCKAEER